MVGLKGSSLLGWGGGLAGPVSVLGEPVIDGTLVEGEGTRYLRDGELVMLTEVFDAAEGVVVDHRRCSPMARMTSAIERGREVVSVWDWDVGVRGSSSTW